MADFCKKLVHLQCSHKMRQNKTKIRTRDENEIKIDGIFVLKKISDAKFGT